VNHYSIREYRPDDFDAVTILWRISRETSLPDFQRERGNFFYEDRDYFRDHILKNNQVWVVESGQQPVAFMAMNKDFIDQRISLTSCISTLIISDAALERAC